MKQRFALQVVLWVMISLSAVAADVRPSDQSFADKGKPTPANSRRSVHPSNNHKPEQAYLHERMFGPAIYPGAKYWGLLLVYAYC